MSTFLELCQDTHEEVGMAGVISSVDGQTGMLNRIVSWVKKADKKIQSLWTDWEFLWAEWELTLADGIDEYSPPDLLGSFNTESFWIDSGTDDASKIVCIPYNIYERQFKHLSLDDDTPDSIVILPNKQLKVLPNPTSADAGKIISCDYWRKPVELTNNDDISRIPTQFHQIIVERAKMFHAAFQHDNGAYQEAQVEYTRLLKELESHSLPDQENNRLSSAVEPYVITVD